MPVNSSAAAPCAALVSGHYLSNIQQCHDLVKKNRGCRYTPRQA